MNLKIHKLQRFAPLVGLAAFSWLSFAQAATDCSMVTQIPQSECEVLIDFYNDTDGSNWTDNLGWNVTNTPCDWGNVFYELKGVKYEKGVTCEDGHVRGIDLFNNNLNGEIPSSVTGLANVLWSLKLGSNNLGKSKTIPIPGFLGDLINLRTLSVGDNQFIGPIPDELGNLTKLWSLSLSGNPIGGTIPDFVFDNMSELKTLSMSNNGLSGPLPDKLQQLSNLQFLWLHTNEFTGKIDVLVNLTELVEVSLAKNQLSGFIPPGLGNLSNLEKLSLYTNKLTGTIPLELGKLSKLEYLYLYSNSLSGPIPTEFGNLVSLKKASLSKNKLSGPLPESLGNLADNLEYISIHTNELSGTVEILGELTNLKTLWLYGNGFTGTIDFLGNLTLLEKTSLGYNEFNGSIPASLGGLSKLVQLSLHKNEFCGDIPASLQGISLTKLNLFGNHLNTNLDDSDFVVWLEGLTSSWDNQREPCFPEGEACIVYAINDRGRNNSEIFTITPDNDFEVNALGNSYPGADLEGLAIHPETKQLYASSGDDTAKGYKPGYLYRVRKSDGNLTHLCSMGLGEVSAMAFHPITRILWVSNDKGLFTIDNLDTCEKTEIFSYDAEVEALVWDNDGKKLYASVEGMSSLYQYDDDARVVSEICDTLPAGVEALDILPTGELLFASDQASDTSIHAFNTETCSIYASAKLPIDTPYSDIEGIAWPCSSP